MNRVSILATYETNDIKIIMFQYRINGYKPYPKKSYYTSIFDKTINTKQQLNNFINQEVLLIKNRSGVKRNISITLVLQTRDTAQKRFNALIKVIESGKVSFIVNN